MTETQAAERKSSPGLFEEMGTYWREWPGKGLWFGVLAGWLLLFQFYGNSVFGYVDTNSLFGWMNYAYRRAEDDEHGFLIPVVVLVLFWAKRQELLKAARDVWWPALAVVLMALVLHVVSYMVQQTRISIAAFYFGIWGLMGFVWGRNFLVRSFFPMVLFVFAIPLATVSETVTYPLRILVARIAVVIGHGILAMPITANGSQIFAPDGSYDVAPACSGIRSLTALGAITMIYAFMGFKSWWKRGAILLAAIPLAVTGNVARVTTVVVLGDVFGRDFAMSLEQYLGLITFAVALVCLFMIGSWLRESRQVSVLPMEARAT